MSVKLYKQPVNDSKGEKGTVVDPLKKKRLFGALGSVIKLKVNSGQLHEEAPCWKAKPMSSKGLTLVPSQFCAPLQGDVGS